MRARYCLLAGLSLIAFAASAEAQTPPRTAVPLAAPPTRVAQVQRPVATPPPAAMVAGQVVPHTLIEALSATYSNQPALQAERAKLRATDEGVPTALAGWRPTVQMVGTAGYGDGTARAFTSTLGNTKVQTDRLIGTATATVTQPIYTGGKVQSSVNRSKNQVMAERANLIATEQSSFNSAVSAYVGVIQAEQLLDLQVNNEQVLAKQLQATNDRFRVGEITRTDVAQAEAALEGARATREQAEGTLQTARGTFQQFVGVFPPDDLVPPQPLNLPVRSEQEAATLAASNNPNVITALFNDAAAKDAIDVAFAQLLPTLSLQGQTFQQNNLGGRSALNNGYQVLASLSVPLYQGGSE
jgi:outer membrane protein